MASNLTSPAEVQEAQFPPAPPSAPPSPPPKDDDSNSHRQRIPVDLTERPPLRQVHSRWLQDIYTARIPPQLPVPTMAVPVSTSIDAASFINLKTEHLQPNDVSALDECIICLETYIQEKPVRVTGVPGCTHIIGVKCLNKILTSNPTLAKNCPICRTEWIPAPGSLDAQRRHIEDVRTRLTTRATSYSVAARSDAVPGGRQGLPHPDEIISIDSDDEEAFSSEDEVENYHEYTQAIANIRNRARNTQLSRRQRREEEAARERNGRNVSNPLMFTFGSGSPAPTRANVQSRPRCGEPDPHYQAALHEHFRRSDQAQGNARRSASTEVHAPSRNVSHEPIDVDMLACSPPPTSQPLSRFTSITAPERAPENEATQVLDARSRRLDFREQTLRNRAEDLNRRERDLHKREQQLFVREQRVAQREQKKDDFVKLKQRQLVEMKGMAQRHELEMRGL